MSRLSCGCVEYEDGVVCPRDRATWEGIQRGWVESKLVDTDPVGPRTPLGPPSNDFHGPDAVSPPPSTALRTFDTGATRDTDEGKLDYEGFLSPEVLKRYAEYMHEHRTQPDGSIRGSDNWQAGMPLAVYMKSMWRHFMEVWRTHRMRLNNPVFATTDRQVAQKPFEDALCALLFNAMGYLHQQLRGRDE